MTSLDYVCGIYLPSDISEQDAADDAADQAALSVLGEAIQSLKDLVGSGITITFTNEFGASVNY